MLVWVAISVASNPEIQYDFMDRKINLRSNVVSETVQYG